MSTPNLTVQKQVRSAANAEPRSAARTLAWLLPAGAGVVMLVLDVALVLGAFLAAYWTRFEAPIIGTYSPDVTEYLKTGVAVALVVAVIFAFQSFYDEDQPRPWPNRLAVIVSAVSIAVVVVNFVSVLLELSSLSRLWLAGAWAFSIGGLIVWRSVAPTLYRVARDNLVGTRRVLFVGTTPRMAAIAEELAQNSQVVGYVNNGASEGSALHLPFLGPIARLGWLVKAYSVDEIVVTLPPDRHEQVSRLIDQGFQRSVKIRFLTDLGDVLPHRFEISRLGGRSSITFSPAAKVSWLKRVADLVFGCLLLGALAPLFAVIALLIKLDSPGPVFYRQQRVGKDGRCFPMYKFRSMCQDAELRLDELKSRNEASGPLFKMRDDPRITRVGGVLRRFSLDELPQLFNVLRGDMSLVGPRPGLPKEVDQYEDWQTGRLRAVPGMTGLWQVSGRSEVPFVDMVRLDLHYIRNWSLGLDLEILLRTVPAVFTHRGSY